MIRSDGKRKSNFLTETTVPSGAYFDFTSDGTNYKILDANLYTKISLETGFPLSTYDKTTDPTVSDDITLGYSVGSIWVNVTTGVAWFCWDNTEDAAQWVIYNTTTGSSYWGLSGSDIYNTNTGLVGIGTGADSRAGGVDEEAQLHTVGVSVTPNPTSAFKAEIRYPDYGGTEELETAAYFEVGSGSFNNHIKTVIGNGGSLIWEIKDSPAPADTPYEVLTMNSVGEIEFKDTLSLVMMYADMFEIDAPSGFYVYSLPTSDPSSTDEVWENSGVLQLSGGAGAAVLDQHNTYTKAQGSGITTLTDAATVAWDASPTNVYSLTLGGNRTIAAPTNVQNGYTYILFLNQDATGSRTVTWNSVFKWAGGTAPTLSTDANAVDVLSFVADASGNLHGSVGIADSQ